jgi:hypothetical protein
MDDKNQLAVIQEPLLKLAGVLKSTSLNLPEELSEERWKRVGLELGRIQTATSWWVGDWWAFGESKYGDRKASVESEDWLGPGFSSCVHAASVCRRFESGRRRPLLSFHHHREVAPLDPIEADSFLDWCEAPLKNGRKKPKTIKQLQDEILKRRNERVLEAAIEYIESALLKYSDRPEDDISKARGVAATALRDLVGLANRDNSIVSGLVLQNLVDKTIEELFGIARPDVASFAKFIEAVESLLADEFDPEALSLAQPEVSFERDLGVCEASVSRINKFIQNVKTRFEKQKTNERRNDCRHGTADRSGRAGC